MGNQVSRWPHSKNTSNAGWLLQILLLGGSERPHGKNQVRTQTPISNGLSMYQGFKKKQLNAAVMSALDQQPAGVASAFYFDLEPMMPYYVVGNKKKVKVRFIDGRNSREVIDFNLFLSPQDVWIG